MTAGFVLGAFDLMDVDGSPFAVETLADGTDFGNPQPIEVAIRSLLQDGSATVHEGDDNREIFLRILISAPDSSALAEGASALMAELYKRNTLTYTAADGWGKPTVFDVVSSSLAFSTDDLAENRGEHYWLVRLVCEPFGRSETAQTFTPTGTTVGTARQKSYTITALGSARTEARLHVGSTTALGNTLIYTRPGAQGMIPLRQHSTSGGAGAGTSAAAGNVSGRYTDDITTGFLSSPAKTVIPDGTYCLYARVATASGSGDTVLTSEISTKVTAVATRPSVTATTTVTGLTTSYVIVQLGPPFRLPSAILGATTSAVIDVLISDAFGGVTVRLDEAWLVEIEAGTLTWPDTVGAPPAAKHILVEPPSLAQELRTVMRGAQPAYTDLFGAETYSEGAHMLYPGDNHAFVVTDGTTTAALDGSYYPHSHTHSTV